MYILETFGEYVREWWAEQVQPKPDVDESALTWPSMLSRWDDIETDFQHFFGIDFGSGVLSNRKWRWFRIRLVRLLSEDTAIARGLGLRKQPTLKKE